MAASNPERARKWIYLSLSLLTPLALFVGIIVIKSAIKPVRLVASANQSPDTASKSADPNQDSGQEPKDPNDKKPPRPDHKHPAFKERIEERARMVADQIQARDVNDPNVLKAMRIVLRHALVRPGGQFCAYND